MTVKKETKKSGGGFSYGSKPKPEELISNGPLTRLEELAAHLEQIEKALTKVIESLSALGDRMVVQLATYRGTTTAQGPKEEPHQGSQSASEKDRSGDPDWKPLSYQKGDRFRKEGTLYSVDWLGPIKSGEWKAKLYDHDRKRAFWFTQEEFMSFMVNAEKVGSGYSRA